MDSNYREVKIKKIIVNGREQTGNVISAEDTKGKQELNVTVYTQNSETVEKKGGGKSWIYDFLQKSIFHHKR